MGQRDIIEEYCTDINNVADTLTKLVSSYRLLIGGASELNTITLAKPDQVKDALKLVDDMEDVIKCYIKELSRISPSYFNFCKMESDIINAKVGCKYIIREIDERLTPKETKIVKETDKTEQVTEKKEVEEDEKKV